MITAMEVNFKKFHPDAVIPAYSRIGDAAMDLTTVTDGKLSQDRDFVEYDTKIGIEIPEGFVGLIFPRSSISQYRLSLCNSVPVIDSNYRGSLKLRFRLLSETSSLRYKAGDRIGQLMIFPYPVITLKEVQELSETARGDGSFGSSGV